jgi:syndecan 4
VVSGTSVLTTTAACTGTAWSTSGDLNCNTCPNGYGCSASSPPSLCSWGTYQDGGGSCQARGSGNAGQLDESPTPCSSPSWYHSGDSLDGACHRCPPGYDCTTNGASPSACAQGEYSTNGAACSSCPAGQYCPDEAASGGKACPTSPYMTYSTGGTHQCALCQAGYECSSASSETACTTNTEYSPGGAQTCLACPAGFSCPNADQDPVPCAPGYFSTAGASSCSECPAGSYCISTITADGDAQQCGPGTYSAAGATRCRECPAGSECPGNGSTDSSLTACTGLTYSLKGADSCTAYTAGTEFVSNDAAPRPCQAGYYATEADTGGVCTQCPEGYECSDPASAPQLCGDTYSCPAGTSALAASPDCEAWEDCSYTLAS